MLIIRSSIPANRFCISARDSAGLLPLPSPCYMSPRARSEASSDARPPS